MVEVMQDALEQREIVRLGDLGSLRITISSNGEDSPEAVDAYSVKGAKTVFTPGLRLKKMLKNLAFEKIPEVNERKT